MMNRDKKIVLKSIAKTGTVSSYSLYNIFSKTGNAFYFMEDFDNSIMRYVRRLASAGYLKRTARGFYKVTKRGQKFVKKNV